MLLELDIEEASTARETSLYEYVQRHKLIEWRSTYVDRNFLFYAVTGVKVKIERGPHKGRTKVQYVVGVFHISQRGKYAGQDLCQAYAFGGYFMRKWEPMHAFALCLNESTYDSLPLDRALIMDSILQVDIWAPHQLATDLLASNEPDEEARIRDEADRKFSDERDTFFERPYGPSPKDKWMNKKAEKFIKSTKMLGSRFLFPKHESIIALPKIPLGEMISKPSKTCMDYRRFRV